MRYFVLFAFLSVGITTYAQKMTGPKLLDKAIAYHDPNSNWNTFEGTLHVRMETPNSSDRVSTIMINLPQSTFELQVSKDGDSYTYKLDGTDCKMSLNGSNTISDVDKEKFRLNCKRGRMYRDYYTYLYGLPMKLKNKGTIVQEEIEKKDFKGKEYLVLKVNYSPEVGKDTWYFYFDPENYAMKVYQFFHEEVKNDGEYILLSGMEEINGIKMPKKREWYYNKDDKYLGTDILTKTNP